MIQKVRRGRVMKYRQRRRRPCASLGQSTIAHFAQKANFNTRLYEIFIYLYLKLRRPYATYFINVVAC